MRETYYLCRVPWKHERGATIVLYAEGDYKYQRHHEQNLRVPNPDSAVVLLAQGSFKEMMLFKELAGDLTNVS